MNILTSDFECNTFAKGNPYSKQGKAVCLGYKENDGDTYVSYDIMSESPDFKSIWLKNALCVFFNAKFDLAWYRRLGFDMPTNVWCCQLAEFILERQSKPYPSLEETAIKYGLGNKLDVIKLEYWDKGVDTEDIPPAILSDYCKQDVDLTYAIYLRQQEAFIQRPGLYRLFKLACKDLLVLQDMEHNGLLYNEDLCKERAASCSVEIEAIKRELEKYIYDY